LTKLYYDKDVDISILQGKIVAVIGYGSQGRAQALNLRDSGVNVVLGLRPRGRSWKIASSEGFEVYSIDEAVKKADIILMLIPDMVQPEVYKKYVEPNLSEGKALGFAHGFNVHFGLIKPPNFIDVFMVAPKSPGQRLREEYVNGRGVPALVAIYQDYTGNAKKIALAIARGIGATRAGVLETTFKEETETDLIGEQTVLVGGLMELIKKGFETLVELGYQPELAYFETLNEAKLIMDLIWRYGIVGMLERVSETARYGGLTVGPKIIDDYVKTKMKKAAERIINKEFTKEWIEEYKSGCQKMTKLLKHLENHPIERIGRELRKLMGLG